MKPIDAWVHIEFWILATQFSLFNHARGNTGKIFFQGGYINQTLNISRFRRSTFEFIKYQFISFQRKLRYNCFEVQAIINICHLVTTPWPYNFCALIRKFQLQVIFISSCWVRCRVVCHQKNVTAVCHWKCMVVLSSWMHAFVL